MIRFIFACHETVAKRQSFSDRANYSSTVTLHGGPVVLRRVRATSCFNTGEMVKTGAWCLEN